jgi:uncharacterized membrane protein YqjE
VELAESHVIPDGGTAGEPSVASALEHVAAATQGVIASRMDLALLEAKELLSRSLQRAALVVAAVILAAAAWLALAACLVLFLTPDAGALVRLAAFAGLNGGGALGLIALAGRRGRSRALVPAHGGAPHNNGTVSRRNAPRSAEGMD